ncbi:MAG TPA: AAA family ATPase, partial [Vicinamibacteria bacterium]|nr:AAA family ATPase [Vicinamibacteria bacterium]
WGQCIDHYGAGEAYLPLLDTVWTETVVSEGTLTTCLSLLRHALGEDAQQPRYIATVHRLGYRFVAPVTQQGSPPALAPPLGAPPPAPPPRLVGRAAELAQLHACFAQARQGTRQTVFITGEAGMGKTTLVDAFVAEVAAAQTAWIGWGQCIDHYGAGEAYLPLLDALGHLSRGPAGAQLGACVRQYAPSWLGPLAALVGEEAWAAFPEHGVTPQRMLRELAEALEAFTAAHPLLLVLEDLHWSDAATVEALALLARRRDTARLLVLGTYRPVELILRQHPLKTAKQELQLHGHCADVPVGYLPVAAVQAYLAQREPAAGATAAQAAWVHQRTEGHPLFMVHVVEELARGGWQTATPAPAAAGGSAAVEVPVGLRPLLELQLGQLDAEAQQVLEGASVVGAEFAEASVAAGLSLPLEAIAARCEGLAQRGQFIEDRGLAVWPDGTVSGRYGFRHALYQEVLYERMGSGRRMRCHRAIGRRLEEAYGAQVAQIAAVLAIHFERGHDPARAVRYRQQAAEQALGRYAYQEAVSHLTQGLALLATLPETPARAQQELDLQLTLGPALIATRGQAAPEVAQTYARAWALCAQSGDTPRRFPILWGLCLCYRSQGALRKTRDIGEQLVQL